METKVIVIDDQPLEGDMIGFVLERDCPQVRYIGQALSARRGVELVEETLPDVVFLDIEMPGMDGISAIRLLREKQPTLHIIILTAFDDFKYVQRAMREGANDYLLKPIRPEEVVTAVQRSAERWKAMAILSQHLPPEAGPKTHPHPQCAQEVLDAIQAGEPGLAESAARRYVEQISSQEQGDSLSLQMACIELAAATLHLPGSQGEGISFLYQELVRGVSIPGSDDRLPAQLADFARACAELTNRAGSDMGYRQVAAAKRYVEEHLPESITLKGISQNLFLSTAYFSRLFKEKTGENFSSYLAGRRIERAKLLLATTDLPIAEVAEAIGYREANSFSRLFKTITGLSPSTYRSRQHDSRSPA